MKKLTLLLCFVSFLTKAQNITVASGKSFTIEKTGSVTMSGNFSNSGTFTLNSDSDEFSSHNNWRVCYWKHYPTTGM